MFLGDVSEINMFGDDEGSHHPRVHFENERKQSEKYGKTGTLESKAIPPRKIVQSGEEELKRAEQERKKREDEMDKEVKKLQGELEAVSSKKLGLLKKREQEQQQVNDQALQRAQDAIRWHQQQAAAHQLTAAATRDKPKFSGLHKTIEGSYNKELEVREQEMKKQEEEELVLEREVDLLEKEVKMLQEEEKNTAAFLKYLDHENAMLVNEMRDVDDELDKMRKRKVEVNQKSKPIVFLKRELINTSLAKPPINAPLSAHSSDQQNTIPLRTPKKILLFGSKQSSQTSKHNFDAYEQLAAAVPHIQYEPLLFKKVSALGTSCIDRWKSSLVLAKSEIFNDSYVRIGLRCDAAASKLLFPQLNKIRLELVLANISSSIVKIKELKLEGTNLLLHNASQDQQPQANSSLQLVIGSGQSHSLLVELESMPLHRKVHGAMIEYLRLNDAIESHSKSTFAFPILPILKYNTSSGFIEERLLTLWNKVSLNWQELISERYTIDPNLFPDSNTIEHLIPNLKQMTPVTEIDKSEVVCSVTTPRT